jgi:hypothetical protein
MRRSLVSVLQILVAVSIGAQTMIDASVARRSG